MSIRNIIRLQTIVDRLRRYSLKESIMSDHEMVFILSSLTIAEYRTMLKALRVLTRAGMSREVAIETLIFATKQKKTIYG